MLEDGEPASSHRVVQPEVGGIDGGPAEPDVALAGFNPPAGTEGYPFAFLRARRAGQAEASELPVAHFGCDRTRECCSDAAARGACDAYLPVTVDHDRAPVNGRMRKPFHPVRVLAIRLMGNA